MIVSVFPKPRALPWAKGGRPVGPQTAADFSVFLRARRSGSTLGDDGGPQYPRARFPLLMCLRRYGGPTNGTTYVDWEEVLHVPHDHAFWLARPCRGGSCRRRDAYRAERYPD